MRKRAGVHIDTNNLAGIADVTCRGACRARKAYDLVAVCRQSECLSCTFQKSRLTGDYSKVVNSAYSCAGRTRKVDVCEGARSEQEAGRLGAYRFIEKPLSKDYVLDALREGLELATLR